MADAVLRQLRRTGPFVGMMVQLLPVLTKNRPRMSPPSDWPKTPRSLSYNLRRLAPQLRTIVINIKFELVGNKRIVTIERTPLEGELPIDAPRPAPERCSMCIGRNGTIFERADQSSSRA